jgi:acyl-CoA reductase-like NAD-dependent aldehyde dehydrogenase
MFMLNGQGCITLKRLFVHENVYTALGTALIGCARNTKTGDAFASDSALGPIQNRVQYERLQSTLKVIENSGARILYQGQIPNGSRGFFVPVTILDNPPDDAEFVKNEVFGPIRSMFKYKDVEEAIRRANASPYGLGASVWGGKPEQLDTVARRLEAGTVWINQHLNPHPDLPFGGFKESGFGVEFGREGLQAFCNIQIIARK